MKWYRHDCYCGASMAFRIEDWERPSIYVHCFKCTAGTFLTDANECQEPLDIQVVSSQPRSVTDYPRNNTLCSVCHLPQYQTPSGPVCVRGHGGTDSDDEL